MIDGTVRYQRWGLTDEEVDVCVRCEAVAVKLIEAGFPVDHINDKLLNFFRDRRKRNLAPTSLLTYALAVMAFTEVNSDEAAPSLVSGGAKAGRSGMSRLAEAMRLIDEHEAAIEAGDRGRAMRAANELLVLVDAELRETRPLAWVN
jgi:hypothetical protein